MWVHCVGQCQDNHVTRGQTFLSEFSHSWTKPHTKLPGNMVPRARDLQDEWQMIVCEISGDVKVETNVLRQEQKTQVPWPAGRRRSRRNNSSRWHHPGSLLKWPWADTHKSRWPFKGTRASAGTEAQCQCLQAGRFRLCWRRWLWRRRFYHREAFPPLN